MSPLARLYDLQRYIYIYIYIVVLVPIKLDDKRLCINSFL